MSRPLALIAFACLIPPTFAAPRERGPTADALMAGEQYARHLQTVVEIVAHDYFRPVKPADLYEAALAGLYATALRPLPPDVGRDLRRAADDRAMLAVVARARAAVDGVSSLADGRDVRASIAGLTAVLDPHSVLIPNAALTGTATSLAFGFEFEGEVDAPPSVPWAEGKRNLRVPDDAPSSGGLPPLPFRVAIVKPGGPAQQAGLRPGDMVRRIDGHAADLRDSAKAFAALHGTGPNLAVPADHVLSVDRPGRPGVLTIALSRAEFTPESLFGVVRKKDNTWDYWLDHGQRIAYVRLGPIETDSGDLLSEILHDLGDVKGLIFDLRWCPGGYIDAATGIASTFLDDGIVARMMYRNDERGRATMVRADGGLVRYKAGDFPLLVLVNGDTVGGGELIAAALQDNGRAVIAGTRTHGKATIQWPVRVLALPGYAFKMSGGTYTRPNGKNLQRFPKSKPTDDWGLRPDPGYEIPMSNDLGRTMKEMHVLYALRPGDSREAMPLDDPAADPQRVRALKLLQALVEERGAKR